MQTSRQIDRPFDAEHDYFEDLRASEKYEDEKGREYPFLRGLIRIAHKNRGGVKSVRSKVVKVPHVDVNGDATPDCIAAVTVSYEFMDGTVFEGSADASFKAHDAPFNKHLTAVAESKAEARAIRRAFLITKVAKEEIGGVEGVVGDPDNEQANSAQLHGIKKIAKSKGFSKTEVLSMIKRDISDITELNGQEARKLLAALNRKKGK